MAGKASKAEFEDARVKALAAHVACSYDPDTPVMDDEKEDLDGIDPDSQYDDKYSNGEGVGGDGNGGAAAKQCAFLCTFFSFFCFASACLAFLR